MAEDAEPRIDLVASEAARERLLRRGDAAAARLLEQRDQERRERQTIAEGRLQWERPPLPNESQLKTFTHAQLQRAVTMFGDGRTQGDVVRDGTFSKHDARRVRLMIDAGLLPLNEKGKLIVDSRVGRKRSRYALRYLDERGSRWIDPVP